MTTNPLQRKQLVFRAKALAQKLSALKKKLASPYLEKNDFEKLKAEIAEIQQKIDELTSKS